MKFLLCLFYLCFSLSSWSAELTGDEKLSDLNQLVSRLRSGYGPLVYKKEVLGIDLDSLAKKYERRILATKSNGEFYYEILRFIAEFKDGHFSAVLPTNHQATLPLSVDLVRGRVLIDEINRDKLPHSQFKFERGDEIVEFNGRPVAEELKDLMAFIPNGSELTIRRYATLALTVRSGSRYPVPTNKIVKLKIRRGESSVIDEATLEWAYEGEPVDEAISEKALKRPNRRLIELSNFEEIEINSHPQFERKFRCSGQTRVEIPSDAKVIMKDPFVAYYYPTEKGNVGYLRLPHYSPQREENTDDWEAAAKMRFMKYEYAISKLEANTVALIIDQQHNCGGFVFFSHEIARLLMTKPFEPIKFELVANKEEYLEFKNWASNFKDTIIYEGLTNIAEIVKAAWKAGQRLTKKVGIDGVEIYEPNKIHYTKPIIVLIDELSGSGGDAFPALMQGTGRALILGERTMGLGGHVWEQAPLLYSQIKPRMTKSLFYHPDGTPIENNGVTPDIHYQPSRNDFIYGYREFRDFYTREALKLVQ